MKHTVMRESVNDDDFLGRAVFSGRAEKRARSGCIMHTVFLGQKGNNLLSVDRLGFCSEAKLTDIQDKNAELRSKPESKKRSFYGWAKITVATARKNRRTVKPAPLKSNPYHADINLPENIDRDDQKAHAKELASNAEWTPRVDKCP